MPEAISIFDVGDYEAQIERGANSLLDGGIVVLPTETVYGAAGLLRHARGSERLRMLRNGAEGTPFTLHLPDADAAARYLGPVSDLGRRMMKKLWPGPVALVFQVPESRQAEVAAAESLAITDLYKDSEITLRCPDHPVFSDVVAKVDGPVALTQIESMEQSIHDDRVDLVFDAGPSRYSKPSTIVRVRDDGYEIVREGVYDQRIIERMLKTTILFICSGNTCRSPMAEALARRAIAQRLGVAEAELEQKGLTVMSAGSFAMPGARATPQAVEALKELGADLSHHRSRALSVELIHQADHIFTMGRSHRAAVMTLVPSAARKTSLLSADGDIEDPIGSDVSTYLALARRLEDMIKASVVQQAVPH